MVASCWNSACFCGPSGSGESWFTSGGLRLEPRRGNSTRDRSLAPVAFLFPRAGVSLGVSSLPLLPDFRFEFVDQQCSVSMKNGDRCPKIAARRGGGFAMALDDWARSRQNFETWLRQVGWRGREANRGREREWPLDPYRCYCAKRRKPTERSAHAAARTVVGCRRALRGSCPAGSRQDRHPRPLSLP
jgi:hypothetical protein